MVWQKRKLYDANQSITSKIFVNLYLLLFFYTHYCMTIIIKSMAQEVYF